MADEITNAELARRIEHVHLDLREDLGKIEAAVGRLLPREVYDLQRANDLRQLEMVQRQLQAHVEQYAKDREEQQQQRKQTIRWVIAAVAIPILGYLLQIILSSRGVSP